MEFLYLLATITSLLRVGVNGRAVNISSMWFLPEEGFPVFYRFFSEKVTWDEAQAVCGSHHADMLKVQTSAQMDVTRAYLKEIDVVDNVWIGLKKELPEEPFSWTNGEKLLGEGYWIEPIPKSNEQLCAAIDPAADFRWSSFYCRGPQVAPFVCQLPVPVWAKNDNGCLISSLPSLTVTFIPEAGVIQLLSDCGLDGTRRIACNEKTNHEEIIKRLSCEIDAFASTVFSRSTTVDTVIINTQGSSLSDYNKHVNRYKTTKSEHPLTRHRRSVTSTFSSTVSQQQTSPSTNKQQLNLSSYVFPHSPYLASERNAPSTQRSEPAKKMSSSQNATTNEITAYKPLPVIIITGENNDSVPSGTSESSPPIVLLIENKDLEGAFLFPIADDVIISNPSLSPAEIISADVVGVDNITVNATANQTTPVTQPDTPLRLLRTDDRPLTTTKPETTHTSEELLDTVDTVANEDDHVPSGPNRGRLHSPPNQPFFYPRFLNRVLG